MKTHLPDDDIHPSFLSYLGVPRARCEDVYVFQIGWRLLPTLWDPITTHFQAALRVLLPSEQTSLPFTEHKSDRFQQRRSSLARSASSKFAFSVSKLLFQAFSYQIKAPFISPIQNDLTFDLSLLELINPYFRFSNNYFESCQTNKQGRVSFCKGDWYRTCRRWKSREKQPFACPQRDVLIATALKFIR